MQGVTREFIDQQAASKRASFYRRFEAVLGQCFDPSKLAVDDVSDKTDCVFQVRDADTKVTYRVRCFPCVYEVAVAKGRAGEQVLDKCQSLDFAILSLLREMAAERGRVILGHVKPKRVELP